MNELLTGIQRDVVIQYMRTQLPVLRVTLAESSGAKEAPFFELASNQYRIQQTVIVFQKKLIPPSFYPIDMTAYTELNRTPISISFYYNRRGLQFSTVLQTSSINGAFGIPDAIEKTTDTGDDITPLYQGSLFIPGTKIAVPCVSTQNYPLFNPFVWQTVEIDKDLLFYYLLEEFSGFYQVALPPTTELLVRKKCKMLFLHEHKIPKEQVFPFEACITTKDISLYSKDIIAKLKIEMPILNDVVYIPFGDGAKARIIAVQQKQFASCKQGSVKDFVATVLAKLCLLVPAAYLACNAQVEGSVQGRILPLDVLFLSDTHVCFGCSKTTLNFEENQEYQFCIKIGMRTIKTACIVEKICARSERLVAICVFKNLALEDKRFLYEKHYGTRFGG